MFDMREGCLTQIEKKKRKETTIKLTSEINAVFANRGFGGIEYDMNIKLQLI
jgi:hypothetical protein